MSLSLSAHSISSRAQNLHLRFGPWLALRSKSWIILGSLVALSLISLQGSALAQSDHQVSRFKDGIYWRCTTDHGPIHVWAPVQYRRRYAGVVVYVHGYSVSADEAWREFNLAEQFRMSQRNAVFIVPEAPRSPSDSVRWSSLSDLSAAIRRCGLYLPRGAWVVLGHSAAYRTLQGWVDDRRIRQMILLDALYAGERQFERFLERPGTQLSLVSTETSERSRAFVREHPDAVKLREIPSSVRVLGERARRAKLLYLKSQYGHRQLISSKKVIPLMLKLTRLSALPSPDRRVERERRRPR